MSDPQLVVRGEPLESACGALLMLHGRGSRAEEILALADELPPAGFAFVAPSAPAEAGGNTWYPHRFLEPLERNEPALSRSLGRVAASLAWLAERGVAADRVILLGFSQGGCLAAEFAARNARRYGGLAVLSGGLIGPPGLERCYDGSLAGTPVLVGCSDVDPHIPLERVRETAQVLGGLGADVTERVYPGLGHQVTADEIEWLGRVMQALSDRARRGS